MNPENDGIYLLQQDLRKPQWVRFFSGSWYPLDRCGELCKHSPYEMIACGWQPAAITSGEEMAAMMERYPRLSRFPRF